jgi:DNA-binding FadR family transcriptional regulator
MVAADLKFHEFIYGLSGNPLIAPVMASHWTQTQRVMGEVLMKDETPRDIWDQHADILQAVARGDAAQAEALARSHITQAANFMVARLESEGQPVQA